MIRDQGFEFRVAFASRGYAHRRWEVDLDESKFDYVILDSNSFKLKGDAERTVFTYSGIGKAIRSFGPALLIVPGFSLASTKVCFLGKVRHIPYLIWSGTIKRFGAEDSTWRVWQKKAVVRGASGAIVYGHRARQYLIDLGLPAEKVFVGVNTVDTAYYAQCRQSSQRSASSTGPKSLLYVGHLTSGKRVDLILSAVAHLSSRRTDFVLRIVGTGSEERRLRAMVADLGIAKFVTFEGFRQKAEVLAYLAGANCFLFPSEYDIWGLVLNEAMAAGLPCIASMHAGATDDLIKDGESGFVVDFNDSRRVSDLLNWILDRPDEAKRIGERASAFVSKHATIRRSASGFMRAISQVLQPAPEGQ